MLKRYHSSPHPAYLEASPSRARASRTHPLPQCPHGGGSDSQALAGAYTTFSSFPEAAERTTPSVAAAP